MANIFKTANALLRFAASRLPGLDSLFVMERSDRSPRSTPQSPKMSRGTFTFKERFAVTSEYKRATWHNLYGKVVISVAPATSFLFRSEAVWPLRSYDEAVLKGIRDVLDVSEFYSRIGAEFVLLEIGWRDEESYWDSYYNAARKATEEILRKIEASLVRART